MAGTETIPSGRWVATFKLKDLLTNEDVSSERAQELGRQMADRLQEAPAEFKAAAGLSTHFRYGVDNQETFNELLDGLYDVADQQRIWID